MTPAIINAVRCKNLKEVDKLINDFNNTGTYSPLPVQMYINKEIAHQLNDDLTYRSIICKIKE